MLLIETRPCPRCQGVVTLKVTRDGLEKYKKGVFIQDAFPELSDSDRERLMSGFCPTCWSALFPPEEDEE